MSRRVAYPAAAYDRLTAGYVTVYDELAVARLAMLWRRRRGPGKLLDVGTGTARLLIRIAADSRFDGLELAGLDLYDDMLAQARRSVAGAGFGDRIAIVKGDAHALPIRSRTIDLVLSRSTIHHWDDPAQAIREVDRVLKLDGAALLHDIRRDADRAALSDFDEARARAGVPASNPSEKLALDELEEVLRRAGVADRAFINAPAAGPAALGFEVLLVGRQSREALASAAAVQPERIAAD